MIEKPCDINAFFQLEADTYRRALAELAALPPGADGRAAMILAGATGPPTCTFGYHIDSRGPATTCKAERGPARVVGIGSPMVAVRLVLEELLHLTEINVARSGGRS